MKRVVFRFVQRSLTTALSALVLLGGIPDARAAGSAGASASVYAYDTVTKGAWNGMYGREGYVLFGYGGADAEPVRGDTPAGSREVANFSHDLAVRPSYVAAAPDGWMYEMNDGVTTWIVENGGDGDHVLDPPAGSGFGKLDARTARGTPGSDGDIKRFVFHLSDNREHLFSVYFSGDMNHKYYTIRDTEGRILVDTFRGMASYSPGLPAGVEGYPANGALGAAAYITFKVKGSFVFEVMGTWSEGPAGMFFDAVPGAGEPRASVAQYDTETGGAWNGVYGRDGYVLFGYGGAEAPPVRDDTPPEFREIALYASDAVKKPSYVDTGDNGYIYRMNDGAGTWYDTRDQSGNGMVLDAPAGSGLPKADARIVRGTPGGAGDVKTFTFLLNDDEEHLVTVYFSGDMNHKTYAVKNLDGDYLVGPFYGMASYNPGLPAGVEGYPAGGNLNQAAYITFKMRGSFVLETSGTWSEGPAGIFFDPVAGGEPPAPPAKPGVYGYDKETHGAWNGVYGRDGYVLFGYRGGAADSIRGDTPSGNKEVESYTYDLCSRPSYVLPSPEGTMYRMNDGVTGWIELDGQTDSYLVPDPPVGSGAVKTASHSARGTPGSDGDVQRYTFRLSDASPRLFSVYFTGDMNHKYYTLKDPDGQILVDTFRGLDSYAPGLPEGEGFPADGALSRGTYITFLVTGSFVFEVMGAWSEGPSAMFFDPVGSGGGPEPGGQPGEAGLIPDVAFEPAGLVGTDSRTRGAWQGRYGQDGYILLGYGYPGDVPGPNPMWDTWMLMDAGQYDIVRRPGYIRSHDYNLNGALWARASTQEEASLDKPPEAASSIKYDVYGAGGGQARFTFTADDDRLYQFSFYTNQVPSAGVDVTLADAQGQTLVPAHTLPSSTFAGGVYVTYFVRGSFSLLVNKSDGDMTFGPQAFFFDPPAADTLSDLTAEYQEPRAGVLRWNNADASSCVQVERATALAGPYSTRAVVPAGQNTYTDTDLEAGITYYYRLRALSGVRYAPPSSTVAFVKAPAYAASVLAFDQNGYEAAESGRPMTLKAILKANGHPLAGKLITFTLGGRAVGVQIPASLGSSVTNDAGEAVLAVTPDFMGDFTVTAGFAADDGTQIAAASATVPFRIGVSAWTAAPVLFKVSDAVKPGELVSVNGYGMTGTVQVKIAPHTGVPAAQPPAHARALAADQTDPRDGYFVVTRLPADAAPGLYDVWVGNAYGWSNALTLNAARPLFLSEYEAWEGQTIRLSGRNLDAAQFGAASATRLRLRGADVVGQTVTKRTPYSVAFTVSAPPGAYAVEVSNDGGATWAPMESGQTLTVVSTGQDPLGLGVAWAGEFHWERTFPVTDYGASGSDTGDDTDAFMRAVQAAKASGGGVVTIPNGRYYIRQITVPAGVVLLGADRAGTVLVYNSRQENMFQSTGDGITQGRHGFSGFSIELADDSRRPDFFFWLGHPWGDAAGNMALRTADCLFIHNVGLDYSLETGFYEGLPNDPFAGTRGYGVGIIARERFLVEDCRFSGWSAGICHAYVSAYTSYRNNVFRYSQQGYLQSTADYFFAEGNHITGAGWESGSQKETHGIFGRGNVHMEDNTVLRVGSDINDGESYCSDSPGGNFNAGDVINATAGSVTVAPLSPMREYHTMFGALAVQIVAGRGLGQTREVDHIDGDTIYVKEAWSVAPNGTSRFTLIAPNSNVTVYNNYAEDCAKGIYIFGNTCDAVVAGNRQVDTEGVFIWTAIIESDAVTVTSNYASVRDNVLTGVSRKTQSVGVSLNTQRLGSQGRFFAVGAYGIEIRGNTITGDPNANPTNASEAPPDSGIVSWSGLKSSEEIADGYSGDSTNVLIENNTLVNLRHGISLTLGDYGYVLKGNTFQDVGIPVHHEGRGAPENVVSVS